MIAAVRARTERPFQVNVFCHTRPVADAAREAAWVNAEALWTIRDASLLGGRYVDMLDGVTAVIGKSLLVAVQ
jgi:hypothetical protein